MKRSARIMNMLLSQNKETTKELCDIKDSDVAPIGEDDYHPMTSEEHSRNQENSLTSTTQNNTYMLPTDNDHFYVPATDSSDLFATPKKEENHIYVPPSDTADVCVFPNDLYVTPRKALPPMNQNNTCNTKPCFEIIFESDPDNSDTSPLDLSCASPAIKKKSCTNKFYQPESTPNDDNNLQVVLMNSYGSSNKPSHSFVLHENQYIEWTDTRKNIQPSTEKSNQAPSDDDETYVPPLGVAKSTSEDNEPTNTSIITDNEPTNTSIITENVHKICDENVQKIKLRMHSSPHLAKFLHETNRMSPFLQSSKNENDYAGNKQENVYTPECNPNDDNDLLVVSKDSYGSSNKRRHSLVLHDDQYIVYTDTQKDIPPSYEESNEPSSDDDETYVPPSNESKSTSEDDEPTNTSRNTENIYNICEENIQKVKLRIHNSSHLGNFLHNETNRVMSPCSQGSKDAMIYTGNEQESLQIDLDCKKPVRIRRRDFCFYCEIFVLNFSRHVIRNHSFENEVQNILAHPKKSKTRKNLLTALRKKGNYITNVQKCVKPMKKQNSSVETDYLPCSKCLGFYSRKQLWKHKKKCDENYTTSNAQVDAQNFMLRNLKVDKKLQENVFPTMRPDRISLVAKKDALICAFGAQYLRIHREKQFLNVTSRKMRDLAKLLIELKKIKPSIKSLLDVLKPQNYDLVVQATKNVARYDYTKEHYVSPTYAMNISTSLKQCCNIAIMEALKSELGMQASQVEAELKTLVHLIETNWKFDVSSQAANDLNLKKWNKITIVPLASDLKLLKKHLCSKAKIVGLQLTQLVNPNAQAYNDLLETVYCRVLLLNRRRPGELQRLLLSTYENNNDNKDNNYEEFHRAISSTEKILIQSFKRIVIRGKRGRGVPVLFSPDVQKDISILNSVRDKYISKGNNFLFAKPGCTTPLYGYKVIEKHARLCGAKNPKAISSTRLRKHLATLTQVLNMTETDIEQLANFMGHTSAIHRNNYRLPDDVYQTAKISKLLLLMENGKADDYKGKSLDDIELNMDEEIDDVNENEDITESDTDIDMSFTREVSTAASDRQGVLRDTSASLQDIRNETFAKKKRRNLVPWTSEQKKIVLKFFSKHIKVKQPPKRHECDALREQHAELLHNKDWLKIKVFIQNTYKKNN